MHYIENQGRESGAKIWAQNLARGMSMLFVTLHGGKPQSDPHKNNVHAYHKDGTRICTSVLLDSGGGLTLDELRGIYLVDKRLYVVNANKDQNSILCYAGAGTEYTFVSKFVAKDSCNGIAHPFDLTFDDSGHCYVSSQDTNIVTRLRVSADRKTATAAPLAPALPAAGQFYPGTFIGSSVADLGSQITAVPAPAGLAYTAEGPKKHSVRGIVWANNALYVADQPADRIKVYDKDGKFRGQSNQVESPVHLVAWKGNIYVSGANEVLTAKLPNPPGDFILSAIKSVRVKNTSGMAFSDSGHFYVASRTDQLILKFDPDFKAMKFECKLPDDPEFLLHC